MQFEFLKEKETHKTCFNCVVNPLGLVNSNTYNIHCNLHSFSRKQCFAFRALKKYFTTNFTYLVLHFYTYV